MTTCERDFFSPALLIHLPSVFPLPHFHSDNFLPIQLSLSGAQAAVPAVTASVLGPFPALGVPTGSEY